MSRFSWLLALRYIRGAQQKKSISTMVGISFAGIFIGSFALMLTLAIMHGFEVVTYERLQSIHSPVIIRAFGNPINMQTLKTVLEKEFPEVVAISPSVMQQVIIQNPHTDDISTIVGIKGIDPETATSVNSLSQKICPTGSLMLSLKDTISTNKILIGHKIATSLEVDIGDKVTLLFAPDEPKKKKINLTQHEAIIGGLFSTGIEEFDAGLIFGSLSFVHELFPDAGVTHVHLKLKPDVDEYTVVNKLQRRLQIEVYSWKDLYPALVSALKLEKYVMFIILALISLIASMNIISLIFMQINQKKGDIAILRAFGMSASCVRSIFLYMGGMIAFAASTLGIACAVICCILLKKYPFITLPDAYLVTHLPVHLELSHIILVFCCCMLLSFIGILVPLRRTEEIDVTNVLRYNI